MHKPFGFALAVAALLQAAPALAAGPFSATSIPQVTGAVSAAMSYEDVMKPIEALAANLPHVAPGKANLSAIVQNGSFNDAEIVQSGGRNVGFIAQTGLRNTALLQQAGAGQQAFIVQNGVGNIAAVTQR